MKNKIWFTADTHFSSERTLELSKRPFKTIEEMDNTIINNWNSIVDKNDTVYHLGDVGNFEKVKLLNGNITLICGNYDREYYDQNFILSKGIYEVINDDVHSVWVKDNIGNDICINMAHEPSKVNRARGLNEINLFGHIHKLQMVKKFGLNVGTDCHNFLPIDLDTVLFYDNAIRKCYDDEVFI